MTELEGLGILLVGLAQAEGRMMNMLLWVLQVLMALIAYGRMVLRPIV